MNGKKPKYFAVRTTVGREIDVALIVETRIRNYNEEIMKMKKAGEEELIIEEKPIEVYSIVVAPGSRGYVYFEAANTASIYKAIEGIKYVKSGRLVRVEKSELLRLIKPKPVIEMINVKDIVEIIKGPFRGMRAQVLSVDRNKNVVMLSILEAQFNVPITVPADYVKPIKKTTGGV
jgi:transcriptional antiterminator NusG